MRNINRMIRNRIAPGLMNKTNGGGIALFFIFWMISTCISIEARETDVRIFSSHDSKIYSQTISSPDMQAIGPGRFPFASLSGDRVMALKDRKLIRYDRSASGWERNVILSPVPSRVRWYRYRKDANRWIALTGRHVISGSFYDPPSNIPTRIFSAENGHLLAVDPELHHAAILRKEKEKPARLEIVDVQKPKNPVVNSIELGDIVPEQNRTYYLSPEGDSLRGIFQRTEEKKEVPVFGRLNIRGGFLADSTPSITPVAFEGTLPGTEAGLVRAGNQFLLAISPAGKTSVITTHVSTGSGLSIIPASPNGYGDAPINWPDVKLTGFGKKVTGPGNETYGWLSATGKDQTVSLFDPEKNLQPRFPEKDIRERLRSVHPSGSGIWFYLHILPSNKGEERTERFAYYDVYDETYKIYEVPEIQGEIISFLSPGKKTPGLLLTTPGDQESPYRSLIWTWNEQEGSLKAEKKTTFETTQSLFGTRLVEMARSGHVHTVWMKNNKSIHTVIETASGRARKISTLLSNSSRSKPVSAHLDPETGNLIWLESVKQEGSTRYTGQVSNPPYETARQLFQFSTVRSQNVNLLPGGAGDIYLLVLQRSWEDPTSVYLYNGTTNAFLQKELPLEYRWTTVTQLWITPDLSMSEDPEETRDSSPSNSQTKPDQKQEEEQEKEIVQKIQSLQKKQKTLDDLDYLWNLLSLKADYPHHPEIEYVLGLYHHRKGNLNRAIRHYTLALKKDQAEPRYRRSLGRIYLDRKQFRKALNHYSYLVENFQASSDLYLEYSSVLNGLGRRERELEVLDEAVREHPDHAELRHRLGKMHARRGNNEKARNHFNTLLQKHPDFKKAEEVRKWLEQNPASEQEN